MGKTDAVGQFEYVSNTSLTHAIEEEAKHGDEADVTKTTDIPSASIRCVAHHLHFEMGD